MVELLRDRGLEIENTQKVSLYIRNIGYVLENNFVNHCDYYINSQALPPDKLTILLRRSTRQDS